MNRRLPENGKFSLSRVRAIQTVGRAFTSDAFRWLQRDGSASASTIRTTRSVFKYERIVTVPRSQQLVRPRTINREHLLDLAESVVAEKGAAGLTFGTVAEAAGISKASVQSAFGTREALVQAMLERWMALDSAKFHKAAGPNPSPKARVQAHLQTALEESDAGMRKVATLLSAVAGSKEQVASATAWYQARMGNFTAATEEERRLRIAFLAAEGAFYIRYLIGFPMSDELWAGIFEDLKRME